jgi:hypothetical protein
MEKGIEIEGVIERERKRERWTQGDRDEPSFSSCPGLPLWPVFVGESWQMVGARLVFWAGAGPHLRSSSASLGTGGKGEIQIQGEMMLDAHLLIVRIWHQQAPYGAGTKKT